MIFFQALPIFLDIGMHRIGLAKWQPDVNLARLGFAHGLIGLGSARPLDPLA